jgi:3'(2'), 5'-bisphosphate nucleotidase
MPTDHEVAADIATRAGRILLDIRAAAVADPRKAWTLGDDGDLGAHRFIMAELRAIRPGDKVLSEEGADDQSRVGAERVWIVDPLDGTREFGELGRPDWAVHVALVDGTGTPIAGAVALPALGVTLGTDPPPPPPPPGPNPKVPRLVVSRSRPPYVSLAVADKLGADFIAMGSAGAKAMAVVMGEADVYAHAGGQYEWDNCAPVAVAAAAGLHVSRLDGSVPVYNNADPWLPDILICRQEWADPVLSALDDAYY